MFYIFSLPTILLKIYSLMPIQTTQLCNIVTTYIYCVGLNVVHQSPRITYLSFKSTLLIVIGNSSMIFTKNNLRSNQAAYIIKRKHTIFFAFYLLCSILFPIPKLD